jgi:hypothetical protein
MGKYLKTRNKNKRRTNKRRTSKRGTNKRRTNKRRTNKPRSKTRNKRTSKSMSGGGKSEKEIIDELIKENKYEKWKELGSNFGLTSDTLNIKTFKIRPYKYYNVYGEIVNVSMIEPNYRPDLDNVAVFEQFVEEDPSHVKQGTYKIVNSNEPLTTTGLATCTGLTMVIGDKKFMTHLDATTPVSSIIDKIREVISEERVDPKDLEPHIYTGNLETDLTLQKAKDICSAVGIPKENYIIEQVCMFDIVEAPTKNINISKKRQFDDNEYKEVQNDLKFPKYDEYQDDGEDYVYKPDNNYYDDDDEQEYYRG